LFLTLFLSWGAVWPLLLLCDIMRHYDDMKLEDLALVTDGNKMHRFIELAEKGHGICLVSRALNEK
jgi:hypothetical protein